MIRKLINSTLLLKSNITILILEYYFSKIEARVNLYNHIKNEIKILHNGKH